MIPSNEALEVTDCHLALERVLAAVHERIAAEPDPTWPTPIDRADLAYQSFKLGMSEVERENYEDALPLLQRAADAGIIEAGGILQLCRDVVAGLATTSPSPQPDLAQPNPARQEAGDPDPRWATAIYWQLRGEFTEHGGPADLSRHTGDSSTPPLAPLALEAAPSRLMLEARGPLLHVVGGAPTQPWFKPGSHDPLDGFLRILRTPSTGSLSASTLVTPIGHRARILPQAWISSGQEPWNLDVTYVLTDRAPTSVGDFTRSVRQLKQLLVRLQSLNGGNPAGHWIDAHSGVSLSARTHDVFERLTRSDLLVLRLHGSGRSVQDTARMLGLPAIVVVHALERITAAIRGSGYSLAELAHLVHQVSAAYPRSPLSRDRLDVPCWDTDDAQPARLLLGTPGV
jgi:hypothetical protein